MNHIIIKEIYKISLLTKLNQYPQQELNGVIKDNEIFGEIQKIFSNNDLYFINYDKEKCYMCKYLNTIYIIFHSELEFQNEKSKQWKDKMYLHRTILNTILSIKDQIINYITILDNDNKIKKIYISGFGTGGAFATLLAAMLSESYANMYLISCFTFGSPGIGNKKFKKHFNKYVNTSYRIILDDECDKKYYKYNVTDKLILCSDNIYIHNRCKKNIIKKFQQLIGLTPKYDYDNLNNMDKYINNLRNIITLYKINSSRHNKDKRETYRFDKATPPINYSDNSNSISSRDSSKSPDAKINAPDNSPSSMGLSTTTEKILNEINVKMNSIHNLILNYLNNIESDDNKSSNDLLFSIRDTRI